MTSSNETKLIEYVCTMTDIRNADIVKPIENEQRGIYDLDVIKIYLNKNSKRICYREK